MSSHGLRELLSSEAASPSNCLHSNATPQTQEQALQQALFDVLGINGTQADGLIRNGESSRLPQHVLDYPASGPFGCPRTSAGAWHLTVVAYLCANRQ